MMRKGRTIAFRCFLAALAGFAMLVSDGTGSGRATDNRPSASVELAFDRPLDASMAPFVLAASRGLFGAENLAVSFHFADGSPEAIARVAPAGGQFAVGAR